MCIHHYSAMKEIMSFAGKWMKLEVTKQDKSNLKGQISHVLSHLWNLDLK
jgi:hypothetical protein